MKNLHPLLRFYRLVAPLIVDLLPLAGGISSKMREGLEGRRGLAGRLKKAGPDLQGCIWFHVASVGEYEQARPVIAALRAEGIGPIAVTHFSPSGYNYALKRPVADLHDYLPFDRPDAMAELIAAWRPRALVFVKFDCWPNQVLAAERAGVPVVLLAGTLQPSSYRLRPILRDVFGDLFSRFTALGVCTEDDRRRFVEGLGVTAPVEIAGDTRAEQVILRYEEAVDGETARRLRAWGDRRLVLGSTWPPDEKLWLPILPELLRRFPDLNVVLTPHEPEPERLRTLEAELERLAVPSIRLSEFLAADPAAAGPDDAGTARCVLVDSIGVLAEIYRAGDLAYVGGSFTTGVHNTMEPAVAAMPVMFGPVIQNATEAETMVERGAAAVLRLPAEALAHASSLLADPGRLAEVGAKARAIVLEQRGATEKSMALLRSCL